MAISPWVYSYLISVFMFINLDMETREHPKRRQEQRHLTMTTTGPDVM